MRQRKERPGLITRHACCKWPMRDKSSLLVHDFLDSQSRIMARRRFNFSEGRLIVIDVESISIPRKTSLVAGPSVFAGDIGTPNKSHLSNA